MAEITDVDMSGDAESNMVAENDKDDKANDVPGTSDSNMADDTDGLMEKAMDGDLIRIKVRDIVQTLDKSALQALFNDPEQTKIAIVEAWDILPILCEALTENNDEENREFVDECLKGIKYLSQNGNAKEVLLALLEQADTFKADVKFLGLLDPIQIALLRLPAKRHFSLQTTLETLFAHVEIIEIPREMDELDDEERKLLESDPQFSRLVDIMTGLVDFMKPFVYEIPQNGDLTPDLKAQRDRLLVTIFKILSEKLFYLYLDNGDADSKLSAWYCCEKIMKYVSYLCRDLYKASGMIRDLMEADERSKSEVNDDASPLDEEAPRPCESHPFPHVSVAAFHYLVYAEKFEQGHLPQVVTHHHVFEMCLPSIALMFSSPRSSIVDKGSKLALSLLDFIPVQKFGHDLLELKQFTAFMDNLLQAVVMCKSKSVRSQCVQIFPKILAKFDSRGKHAFFIYCFNHTGHTGVKGHLLHLLKEEINSSFNKCEDPYMTPPRVAQVVKLLFVLPDGAMTDLLDQSDLIIAGLNFIRYLVIRDKDNESGIWDILPELETSYFEHLRKGLEMARCHYEQEQKNCLSGKSITQNVLNTGIDYQVNVGSQSLPVDLPQDQQLSILQSALYTFDLMQSLLGRVEELVKLK